MTLASLVLFVAASLAAAQEDERIDPRFRVGDIRVAGLQRVSEGTVYNYLPVNIGDELTPARLREAVRALYATGFFSDVEMRRDGNALVVVVQERPSIESFEITGNKDIKTEDLQKSLRNVGLATGKTFDRSVLEDVKQFLTDQYFSRGKYAVRIDAKVEEQPGNRVRVKIDIKEGKRARIRQINLVGNERFSDEQILEGFELKTPNWLSWYRSDDRYSREALQGDLEALRSFYMDRGYANFDIESTQVAIAPEKDDIFITVKLKEGEVFKVGDVKLAGTFVVPEAELKRYLLVAPGQTFSRKAITTTQELIQNRLGAEGYAFAKVDPVPTPNEKTQEVDLTFFVEPGNRVYVRHIAFSGAHRINDAVLRREMRQLEGAWLSNLSVERSKQRVQRLPYVKKVEAETTPVAGSPDMVDVTFEVEEGPSAQLGGGIGYSESQSFILSGNYADSNFMGTGERLAIDLNAGKYQKVYGVSHTDPYTTIDGVARTVSLTYRDVTQFVSASSDFSSETMTAGLDYGYPITEFQTIRFGVALQSAELLTSETGSAQQAVEWVRNNGNAFERSEEFLNFDGSTGTARFFGTKFKTAELVTGWSFDTRNRALFADRGTRHSLSLSYAVPGGEVEYWVANYEFLQFVPLWGRFALAFNAELGFGEDLGDTTSLPPFRQFFAGGPDTVRGFRESRLGPKDNFGNPYGGNMKVVGRTELIIPMPEKWQSQARLSAFFDIGNVFSTGSVRFFGKDAIPGQPGTGTPIDYDFSYDNLKQSTGLAVQWLAPLGIFRFSYAFPLNDEPGDDIRFGDETERFQFSIGQAF
ncbi:MAG TPA: outer membrane protein assembly factor BamA [Steroidobacteraceae bacterium]|nr:outer membrane protein assembly factor BamA [Steroidobacteraceae bacterium]